MKIHNDVLQFIYNLKATYADMWNNNFKDFYDEDCSDVFNDSLLIIFSYQFALLLKSTFKRGIIVWCAPHDGHFAFLDTDGIAYHINGIYERDVAYFIPEEYVDTDILNDSKFAMQYPNQVSLEKILNMIKAYCINTHTMYDEDKINKILTKYHYEEYDDGDYPPNYLGEYNDDTYCITVNDYKKED